MRLHEQVIGGLVAVALVAGGAMWYSVWREGIATRTGSAATAQLDGLVERAARLDATLSAYGAPRVADPLWYTETAALLQQLHSDAGALDSTLTGIAMMPRARLAEALQAAAEAMDRARANFDSGRALMALDVLESDGRPAAAALTAALGTIRTAASDELTATRNAWRLRAGGALGGWVVIWAAGLLWLQRRVTRTTREALVPASDPVPTVVPAAPPSPATRDLDVVADACEAIAHLESAEQLPRVLARATQAIGATGVALWGRDGDALVVLASSGYPEGLAQRLGRVSLTDENLLTGAWHGRQPLTASAPAGRKAALVAPVLGITGAIGVLAAEVPSGTESEPQVVAAARLIAAQLSTVLGPDARPSAQGPTTNGESVDETPAASEALPLSAAG